MTAKSRPAAGPRPARPPRVERERLDVLLVERGLATGRDRARALVMAREVLVDGEVATRPAAPVPRDAAIEVKTPPPFVSRGGEKLEAALEFFGVDVTGRSVLDAGASTGGFTDCVLSRGASRVFAVDVGTNQLHERLLADPRVVSREKTHIRDVERASVPFPCSLVVADLSFISLVTVMPWLAALVMPEPGHEAIEMIRLNVNKLRDLSPLWEMYKDGVDLSTIQWAAH